MFSQSAPLAEAVFYNSDMDDTDSDEEGGGDGHGGHGQQGVATHVHHNHHPAAGGQLQPHAGGMGAGSGLRPPVQQHAAAAVGGGFGGVGGGLVAPQPQQAAAGGYGAGAGISASSMRRLAVRAFLSSGLVVVGAYWCVAGCLTQSKPHQQTAKCTGDERVGRDRRAARHGGRGRRAGRLHDGGGRGGGGEEQVRMRKRGRWM